MSNTTPSPNMNLPVPIVGSDPGPTWASDLNSCLALIDSHTHTSGSGVQITPSGMNISGDLSMSNNNLTLCRSTRYQVQGSTLSASADVGCTYVTGVDLYYRDVSGNNVRITQSGGVAGSPGSIGSLSSPATATYVSANATFVWQSDANTSANLDCASLLIRNLVASSYALTLAPPNAMGANYTLTLPSVPAQTNVMTLDASGSMGSITYDAVGAAMTSTGANAIAATSSNANFGGKAVKENNLNIVVSNTNAGTNSLAIVRGSYNQGSGTIIAGEGFSVSRNSAGDFSISFTTAFLDAPAVTATAVSTGVVVAKLGVPTTTGFNLLLFNTAFAFTDGAFSFMAIGQRA